MTKYFYIPEFHSDAFIKKLDKLTERMEELHEPSVKKSFKNLENYCLKEAKKESSFDEDALIFIALEYIEGFYTDQNVKLAIELLERCTVFNNKNALIILAEVYSGKYNEYVEPIHTRYSRAYNYYKKASELGAGHADLALAEIYNTGSLVPRNIDQALKYALSAHEKGFVEATILYAELRFEYKNDEQYTKLIEMLRANLPSEEDSLLLNSAHKFLLNASICGVSKDQKELEEALTAIYRLSSQGMIQAVLWLQEHNLQISPDNIGTIAQEQQHNDSQDKISDSDNEDKLDALNQLIGLKNIKEHIQDIVFHTENQKLRQSMDLPKSSITMHCVFSGPPGTGKTTVARLYGQILKNLGYLTSGHLIETDREGLIAEYVGQTAVKTKKIIKRAMGGVLFIDEAYSLNDPDGNDFGQEAISALLKAMEDHRDNLVVIVAGYEKEMQNFLKMNPGLQSRFAQHLKFLHYSAEELGNIFQLIAQDSQYTVSNSAIRKVVRHVSSLGKDQLDEFGNARGIRNIFEKSIITQSRRIMTNGITDKKQITMLTENDVLNEETLRMERIKTFDMEDILKPFDKLVGLGKVKKEINDLAYLMKSQAMRKERGVTIKDKAVMHTIFAGPPGTGKTTVARLFGKILFEVGYLKTGHVIEVDKGSFLSDSENISKNVKNIVKRAEGGVLFVDEAYSLSESSDNGGYEIITALLKLMEDRRDRFVCILAGYDEEMKKFLKSNPGLKSRIPRYIKFPNYSSSELIKIFEKLCSDNQFSAENDLKNLIKDYLEDLDERNISELGNARLIRNIYDSTVANQARRILEQKINNVEDLQTLKAEDFVFNQKASNKRIGFL